MFQEGGGVVLVYTIHYREQYDGLMEESRPDYSRLSVL